MASQRPPEDKRSRRSEQQNSPGPPVSSNSNGAKPPSERTYQPLPTSRPSASSSRNRGGPPPPPNQFFSPANSLDNKEGKREGQKESKPKPSRPPIRIPIKAVLGYGILIAIIAVVLIALFIATRIFNVLGSISVERQDANGNVISGSSVTGRGRVNIVLLGLDRRPNDQDGTRSDSMLILSVDQDNKTANMLSVPRDLWVKVPGHGNNRINTAYFFGDQERPNQGGPPLVKEALRQNFGIQIDYFVEIDFGGFRSIVDALGGITIDVKKPLVDNEYPTEDYGIKRIYIPAGLQRMNGQTALEYARSRHSDSDLGRNQRQQEVLLAVREQGINLNLLTNTKLQTALQGAIKTDLTPGDMVALGQIAVGMKRETIRQFSIDANITRNTNIDGNDVLVADQNALNQLLRQFQTSASPTTARETARINILNGTFTGGLAARTQKFLETKGVTITGIDQDPDAGKYPHTIINVYNGKQQTANELAGLLGIKTDQIKAKTGGPAGIDIEVICGDDLKLPE